MYYNLESGANVKSPNICKGITRSGVLKKFHLSAATLKGRMATKEFTLFIDKDLKCKLQQKSSS